VARKVTPTEVVGIDEDDVGLGDRCFSGMEGDEREEKCREEQR
jgi:hypothetical protein